MHYVCGPGFNAEDELNRLLVTGMPRDHTEAYISLLGSLDQIYTQGFGAARHDWTRTGENDIWLFTDGPIRCAIQVQGEDNEERVTLLATAFAEGRSELVEWLFDFVKRADKRLLEGQVVE